jgi:phosphoserine phosphatase
VNGSIVVFDLDGTLALIDHRRHFVAKKPKNFQKFEAACVDDPLNVPVARAWAAYRAAGYELWIVSGRTSVVRAQTEAWLQKYAIDPDRLLLRDAKDNRPDFELKRSWLMDGTIPRDRILCVYDDRSGAVAMWREHGITCFQVAPGDF